MSVVGDVRHKYEYAVDPNADTAPARVVRMVGCDKEVLEIGSGPGSITRLLHDLNHCRVTALEIDPEALRKVAPYCVRALPADLDDPAWPALLGSKRFQRVVAADVLEHLRDPLAALKGMATLLDSDGAMIISLPHVGHAALVGCLLNEDFEYRDWGLLDKTHIRFFGIKNIQVLFDQAGLKIVEVAYVIRHPETTEFVHQWSMLSPEARRVALGNPFGQVYQVVLKAVPRERPGNALNLMLEVPTANSTPANAAPSEGALRRLARRYLSDDLRRLLRWILNRAGF